MCRWPLEIESRNTMYMVRVEQYNMLGSVHTCVAMCIKLFFYNFYVVKFFSTREINPWGQEEESNEIDRAIVTNRPFSLL